MKITFQIWYLSPEKPEGLPILKEGSGKGREIVHMIEYFLSTHKSVGLTKSTWDYWAAKGLSNEIWRPSPLGHLWHEVIIICQLFSSLCEMNVVLCSLWEMCSTELQLSKMACIQCIFQRTHRPLRSPIVLRMNWLPSFIVVSLVHISSFNLRLILIVGLFMLFDILHSLRSITT